MFHSRIHGRIARVQSVKMETAEKKNPMLLLSFVLQVPCVVSPQRVVIGWQTLAVARMKIIAVITVRPMIPHSVQTNRRRESAMRSIVTQMLDLIGTEHAE